MPSMSRPSPCSGCARRTFSKRRTRTSSRASRNSTRGAHARARPGRGSTPRRSVENARLRTSMTTASRVTAPWLRLPSSTSVRDQLRRQVVDDEVAEILEALGRGAAAGAGQPGDDDRLERRRSAARRGIGPGASLASRVASRPSRSSSSTSPVVTFTAGAGARRRGSAATIASAVCGPMPGTSAMSSTVAARSRLSEPKCAAAPCAASRRGRGCRRAPTSSSPSTASARW